MRLSPHSVESAPGPYRTKVSWSSRGGRVSIGSFASRLALPFTVRRIRHEIQPRRLINQHAVHPVRRAPPRARAAGARPRHAEKIMVDGVWRRCRSRDSLTPPSGAMDRTPGKSNVGVDEPTPFSEPLLDGPAR